MRVHRDCLPWLSLLHWGGYPHHQLRCLRRTRRVLPGWLMFSPLKIGTDPPPCPRTPTSVASLPPLRTSPSTVPLARPVRFFPVQPRIKQKSSPILPSCRLLQRRNCQLRQPRPRWRRLLCRPRVCAHFFLPDDGPFADALFLRQGCIDGFTCSAAFICEATISPSGNARTRRNAQLSKRGVCPSSHTACPLPESRRGFECIDTEVRRRPFRGLHSRR